MRFYLGIPLKYGLFFNISGRRRYYTRPDLDVKCYFHGLTKGSMRSRNRARNEPEKYEREIDNNGFRIRAPEQK